MNSVIISIFLVIVEICLGYSRTVLPLITARKSLHLHRHNHSHRHCHFASSATPTVPKQPGPFCWWGHVTSLSAWGHIARSRPLRTTPRPLYGELRGKKGAAEGGQKGGLCRAWKNAGCGLRQEMSPAQQSLLLLFIYRTVIS